MDGYNLSDLQDDRLPLVKYITGCSLGSLRLSHSRATGPGMVPGELAKPTCLEVAVAEPFISEHSLGTFLGLLMSFVQLPSLSLSPTPTKEKSSHSIIQWYSSCLVC